MRTSFCFSVTSSLLTLLFLSPGCEKKPSPAQPSGQTVPPAQAAPVQAAGQTSAAGPRWLCQQPVLDFGEVWVGSVVQKEFQVRNGGNEVLRITKASPRCSCSSSPNFPREIPPGATASFQFVLKTEGKSNGQQGEYITFDTNDSQTPRPQLWVRGFIRTAFDPEVVYDSLYESRKKLDKTLEPPTKEAASFGKIRTDDRLHRVIKLRNTSGRPLSLTLQPLPPTSRLKADLQETVAGQEFDLTITGDPPFPLGHTSAQIIVQTNIPEDPSHTIWADAYVPPRIEVIPPDKMVIDQDMYPQKVRRITITNNGSTPVDVLGIAASEPNFDISLLPRDPAKPQDQYIDINLPGGAAYRPPPYGEVIEIKTNDAEVPLIRITVLPSLKAPQTQRPPDKPLVMHQVALP